MRYKFVDFEVNEGGFLVVRYVPMLQPRGIVAARIVEVYDDGFCYQNLAVGVDGDFDFSEPLLELTENNRLPISSIFVHTIGGFYIPKEREFILPSVSQDKNYQRSLEGLKMPDRVQTKEELQSILDEG